MNFKHLGISLLLKKIMFAENHEERSEIVENMKNYMKNMEKYVENT